MAKRAKPTLIMGLDQLIAEAKARLSKNPDYIFVKATEKARAEIVGVSAKNASITLEDEDAFEGKLMVINPLRPKMSQLAGAAAALDEAGHPLPIRELMEGAEKAGAHVGGDNPLVNFGSSLSKSDKFKSVRYREERCWWFSDRAVPGGQVRKMSKEAAE